MQVTTNQSSKYPQVTHKLNKQPNIQQTTNQPFKTRTNKSFNQNTKPTSINPPTKQPTQTQKATNKTNSQPNHLTTSNHPKTKKQPNNP